MEDHQIGRIMSKLAAIESFVYRDNQVGWMAIAGGNVRLFTTEKGARDFIRVCDAIDEYAERGIPVENPIAELLDKEIDNSDSPIPPNIRIESLSYRCRGIDRCDGHIGWMVIVDGKDDSMFTTEAEAKAYARARDALGELIRSTETKN
jgi:hypothetical protein